MNKPLLITSMLFGCLLPDCLAQTRSFDEQYSTLPVGVQRVLKKAKLCKELGSDDTSLLSMQQQREWQSRECHNIDQDIEELRKKYASLPLVIEAVDCVEETANAKFSCPDF